MTARPEPPLKTWMGSSIGLGLVMALVALTVLREVLPALQQGPFDHDSAAQDPMVWTRLYVGLLVVGLLPSLVALIFSIDGLLAGGGREAWLGVTLNLVFLLTVGRLVWILAAQGFFGFLVGSIEAFIEV